MIQRWLLLWLLISSWLAFAWPRVVAYIPGTSSFDPFLASAAFLPWFIAAAMFAIGLMLPRDEVDHVLRRWPRVLAGSALQYTAMPLLAFLLAQIWGLKGDDRVGLVMVGCVPGAMASNVLTLNAGGNTSYSVSLTTLSTLLSPLAVPLVMQLALATEQSVELDAIATSRSLVLMVVIPVVSGHLWGRRFPDWEPVTRRWGTRVANLAILWVIAVVVARNRAQLQQFRWDLVSVLIVLNLSGYAAGYFGGAAIRIPEAMRRALTLEIGMQNAGLGATLATQLFPDRAAIAIAPALYTFGCMLTGTILARIWASRPRGEPPEDS